MITTPHLVHYLQEKGKVPEIPKLPGNTREWLSYPVRLLRRKSSSVNNVRMSTSLKMAWRYTLVKHTRTWTPRRLRPTALGSSKAVRQACPPPPSWMPAGRKSRRRRRSHLHLHLQDPYIQWSRAQDGKLAVDARGVSTGREQLRLLDISSASLTLQWLRSSGWHFCSCETIWNIFCLNK